MDGSVGVAVLSQCIASCRAWLLQVQVLESKCKRLEGEAREATAQEVRLRNAAKEREALQVRRDAF